MQANFRRGSSSSSRVGFEILDGSDDDVQEINPRSFRPSRGTRTKLVWTTDLHKRFVEAVETLGVETAVPRKIVELMNVEGITRDHVASHLQKYRQSVMSDKYDRRKAALKRSTMPHGTFWSNPPRMVNQEQNNCPSYRGKCSGYPSVLDTSVTHFPAIGDSSFNFTTSPELVRSGSLPYEGHNLQAMNYSLDEQGNIIGNNNNFSGMNWVNSSNSGFVHNPNGFNSAYGDCSTEEQMYNNFETGFSSGVQDSSNSYSYQNPNGFERKFSNQSGFVEPSLFYGTNSNSNLENKTGEDDLVLNEADMASLLLYSENSREYGGTSNNERVTLDIPNQDVNWQNFLDSFSHDFNQNEETTTINEHQTLDGYLHNFESNVNMDMNAHNFLKTDFLGSNNYEATSINEPQTLDGYLPNFDPNVNKDVNGHNLFNSDLLGSNSYKETTINEPRTLDGYPPNFESNVNMDVNGHNSLHTDSLISNHNEETIHVNEQQTFDGYLLDFEPNFNMNNNEQFMGPMWSPNPYVDEMTLEDLISHFNA